MLLIDTGARSAARGAGGGSTFCAVLLALGETRVCRVPDDGRSSMYPPTHRRKISIRIRNRGENGSHISVAPGVLFKVAAGNLDGPLRGVSTARAAVASAASASRPPISQAYAPAKQERCTEKSQALSSDKCATRPRAARVQPGPWAALPTLSLAAPWRHSGTTVVPWQLQLELALPCPTAWRLEALSFIVVLEPPVITMYLLYRQPSGTSTIVAVAARGNREADTLVRDTRRCSESFFLRIDTTDPRPGRRRVTLHRDAPLAAAGSAMLTGSMRRQQPLEQVWAVAAAGTSGLGQRCAGVSPARRVVSTR